MNADRFDHVSVDFAAEQGPLRVVDDVSFDIARRRVRRGDRAVRLRQDDDDEHASAGFVTPTQGAVLLDGAADHRPGPDRGVIFQEYGVFPWLTVRENIAFGLQAAANRATGRERARNLRRYLS